MTPLHGLDAGGTNCPCWSLRAMQSKSSGAESAGKFVPTLALQLRIGIEATKLSAPQQIQNRTPSDLDRLQNKVVAGNSVKLSSAVIEVNDSVMLLYIEEKIHTLKDQRSSGVPYLATVLGMFKRSGQTHEELIS